MEEAGEDAVEGAKEARTWAICSRKVGERTTPSAAPARARAVPSSPLPGAGGEADAGVVDSRRKRVRDRCVRVVSQNAVCPVYSKPSPHRRHSLGLRPFEREVLWPVVGKSDV